MQRLEVSGAVRLIYRSLGVKGLNCKTSALFNSNLCKLHKSSRRYFGQRVGAARGLERAVTAIGEVTMKH